MRHSRKILLLLVVLSFLGLFLSSFKSHTTPLPKIAIAHYGPHMSLEETIRGIKEGLAAKGFKDQENITIEIMDVNFDLTLISQMLMKLRASRPQAMIVVATPIAQNAKNTITDIPLFFTDITEPVAAGLLDDYHQTKGNMTGASDKQDLTVMLSFAKKMLPQAKRVGLLFATSEANDVALVEMMKSAATQVGMEVVCIPIEHARDIPFRMQAFKDKVDFIYVGVSGLIQPALPAIVHTADKLHIPVFNANEEAVKQHQVLASMGVSYYQVGRNTAELVADCLQGKPFSSLTPLYPHARDHQAYISKKRALMYGIDVAHLINVTVVE